jgi:hypothetical protein
MKTVNAIIDALNNMTFSLACKGMSDRPDRQFDYRDLTCDGPHARDSNAPDRRSESAWATLADLPSFYFAVSIILARSGKSAALLRHPGTRKSGGSRTSQTPGYGTPSRSEKVTPVLAECRNRLAKKYP